MSEIRLTPHRLTPDMVIAAQDGRVLLRVDLNDGTVEGAVEDMSEAGRIFVEHVRSMFGASITALSSPPADDVHEALAPSAELIVDALSAYYGEERDGWSMKKVRRMRAALMAAGSEVRPYGTVTNTERQAVADAIDNTAVITPRNEFLGGSTIANILEVADAALEAAREAGS